MLDGTPGVTTINDIDDGSKEDGERRGSNRNHLKVKTTGGGLTGLTRMSPATALYRREFNWL